MRQAASKAPQAGLRATPDALLEALMRPNGPSTPSLDARNEPEIHKLQIWPEPTHGH